MNFVWITAFGIVFIFAMTTIGSALVFCFQKEIPPRVQAGIFGFSSGVMLAASVWSLLLPALAEGEVGWGRYAFIPVTIGFLLGGALIYFFDKLSQKQRGTTQLLPEEERAGKLFFSVTIHNIPEGLAVGFAFGAAFVTGSLSACMAAFGLALGMGIQNLPEGAAVSLPMSISTGNKRKGFLYGMLSGAVEPLFAVIGFFFAAKLRATQPWLLSFAAGAMLFVIIEELLPATKEADAVGVWWTMLGFVLMMILDVGLA